MSYMGKVRPTVALTSSDIEDNAVTTSKLIDDAVTSAKIDDGTIATADIADDAVTVDKVSNAINTSIAANTSKVTNATHTGDVTGATALTIAVDAVDIAMLSATGTASSSTFLRGDNAWTAVVAGIGTASLWNQEVGADLAATTVTYFTANWAEQDRVGDAMTESSGVFTFPSTGKWMIRWCMEWDEWNANAYVDGSIWTTPDDGTYTQQAMQRSGVYSSTYQFNNINTTYIFDVTDVANYKVKFAAWSDNTPTISPSKLTYKGRTYVVFERWGDT